MVNAVRHLVEETRSSTANRRGPMFGPEADRARRGRRGDSIVVCLDVMPRSRRTVVLGGESSVDAGVKILRSDQPHVSGGWRDCQGRNCVRGGHCEFGEFD